MAHLFCFFNHNGFNYYFDYDVMGNNSSVKVGTETLISNVYNPISKALTNATYGNGNKVNYTYDSLDRLVIKRLESRIYGYQVNVVQDPVSPGTGGSTGIGSVDIGEGSKEPPKYDIPGPVKPPLEVMSLTVNDAAEQNTETDAVTTNSYSVYLMDNSKYEDKNYSAIYSYDNAGNLSKLSDGRNGDTHKYVYDLSNRLSRVEDSRGNWFQYNYDATNKLSTAASFIGGRNYSTTYSYDKDGKTKNITLPLGKNVEYIYDGLGRTTTKDLKASGTSIYNQNYGYISGANGSTTNLIATLTNNYNGGSRVINYSYDKLGRINEINDSNKGKNTYYYDELGQLTREDNSALNKTIVYTYDKGGNILSKENYNYTNTTALGTQLSKINYQYSDSNWKDKLTSYNGKGITYDAIGNLTTYNNDVYRWEAGRSLKYINGTGKNIEYIYNIDGIRTGKKVNGVEYKYTLEGSRVVCEEIYESGSTPTKTLVYNYGDNGLVGFTFNNTEYFYIRNAQSDIIGILNSAGNVVVEYTYDSWGQVISIEGELKDTVGVINPYRYRGYRYDNETGLYYLQSRYYNPEWGRFINADGLISTGQGLLSGNMFIYCLNNPIGSKDSDGFAPERALTEGGNAGGGPIILSPNGLKVVAQGLGYAAVGIAERLSEQMTESLIYRSHLRTFAKLAEKCSERMTEAPQKVIGHYPEYIEMSNKLGVKAFSVPDTVWNKMTSVEQWAANQKFLDRAIAKGADFNLATSIDKVRPESYLAKEIQYLISQGYKLTCDGLKFIK